MSNTNRNFIRGSLLLGAVIVFATVLNGKQLAGWATGSEAEATGCSEDAYLDERARGNLADQAQLGGVDDCEPPVIPNSFEQDLNDADCGGTSGDDPSHTYTYQYGMTTVSCTLADSSCVKHCKAFAGLECSCGASSSLSDSVSVSFGAGWFGGAVTISTTVNCSSGDCELVKVFGCAKKLSSSWNCTTVSQGMGGTTTSQSTINRTSWQKAGVRNESKPDPTCPGCDEDCEAAVAVKLARTKRDATTGPPQPASEEPDLDEPGFIAYDIELTGERGVDDLTDAEFCAFTDTVIGNLDSNLDWEGALRVFDMNDDGTVGDEFIWDANDDSSFDCE